MMDRGGWIEGYRQRGMKKVHRVKGDGGQG